MCRIYTKNGKPSYVRLCSKKGRFKGLRIPVEQARWGKSGCVLLERERKEKDEININKKPKYRFSSLLLGKCRVCGKLTFDEVCDSCKEEYKKKIYRKILGVEN